MREIKARLHFLGAYKKLEFDLCERLLSTNRFQKQKVDLTILLSSLVSSFFVESHQTLSTSVLVCNFNLRAPISSPAS